MIRHFLRDDDLTPAEQRGILERGLAVRENRFLYLSQNATSPLAGPRAVAFITDKPTLRTQLSFSTGIAELGGFPFVVDNGLASIGVRESIADTTRVLDRQVAAIVWRTSSHHRIEEMASISQVPVINALTDDFHPCQVLADLLTIAQHRGLDALPGTTLTYVGDAANNMANSYLLGGVTAGMHVRLAGPEGYLPQADVVDRACDIATQTGGSVIVTRSAKDAVAGADVIATDSWVSMGDEVEAEARATPFWDYQLNAELLAESPDAQVLHCLPAYRGQEITAEVIDGPRSLVWDESENRLHAQKALLVWLLEQE